jgi:molybdopterin-guanine dinucleotide biosynthesis protein A
MNSAVLGAIIAGGRSTRYGEPKALATVAGARIIDRVMDALCSVTPDCVTIANTPEIACATPLPSRPDAVRDAGALGGIYTALLWAREEARSGILAVACDMPFLSAPLLADLLERAYPVDRAGPDVVVPESGGRRAIEPLCAWYGTSCLDAVTAAVQRGDYRMIGFHEDVRTERVPLFDVRRFGDPEVLFLNVNTREDRELAERIAGRSA